MAVVDVIEQSHLRAGTAPYNAPGTAVRVFLVKTNSKADGDGVVLSTTYTGADGSVVPTLRDAHPTRTILRVAEKSARQADDKNGLIWEVTVTYQYLPPFYYPWDEPAITSWDASSVDTLFERDIDTGKHIKNSAGQPFDPAPTVLRYDSVLTVTKNLETFAESVIKTYGGTTNNATFKSHAQDYVMCVPPKVSDQLYTSPLGVITTYKAVTLQFLFRNPDIGISWQPKLLDAGFCKLVSGSLVPITIGGREPTTPVPLDGSGMPLSPPTGTPTFIDARGYPRSTFATLLALVGL